MPASNAVTIYHNPACGTSRNTLALIRAAGMEPEIVEYLKHPPDRAMIASWLARMGTGARGLLREKEKLAAELGLTDSEVGEEELIGHLLAHPILINRPVVVTARGVRLCRPPERVREILPQA
ncbi:MAG: arsenate reductase (glutaredoxin) [Proteobacteria bacterium]|nr:arsenate reductase (glutaredoxin) [Pseudomonadota bacterium]